MGVITFPPSTGSRACAPSGLAHYKDIMLPEASRSEATKRQSPGVVSLGCDAAV